MVESDGRARGLDGPLSRVEAMAGRRPEARRTCSPAATGPKIGGARAGFARHFGAEAVELVSRAGRVRRGGRGALQRGASSATPGSWSSRGSTAAERRGQLNGWKAADVKAVDGYLADPRRRDGARTRREELKKDAPLASPCAKAGEVLAYDVAEAERPALGRRAVQAAGARAEPDACAALVQLVGDDSTSSRTRSTSSPLGRRASRSASARSSCSSPGRRDADVRAHRRVGPRDAGATLEASETIFEREGRPRRDRLPRLAGALANHVARVRQCQPLAAEGVRPRDAAAS